MKFEMLGIPKKYYFDFDEMQAKLLLANSANDLAKMKINNMYSIKMLDYGIIAVHKKIRYEVEISYFNDEYLFQKHIHRHGSQGRIKIIRYHENGNILETGVVDKNFQYFNKDKERIGKKGKWEYFYPNNNKKIICFYDHSAFDRLIGEFVEWDENGNIIKNLFYKFDSEKEINCYYKIKNKEERRSLQYSHPKGRWIKDDIYEI